MSSDGEGRDSQLRAMAQRVDAGGLFWAAQGEDPASGKAHGASDNAPIRANGRPRTPQGGAWPG
jgi:hypothetical protein